MFIHNGILYSQTSYFEIFIFAFILVGIVYMIQSITKPKHDITFIACLMFLGLSAWLGISASCTEGRSLRSIARPVATTQVHYISNPHQYTQTTADKKKEKRGNLLTYSEQHDTTIIYHHSMPHARRHGIYHVIKKYHYVYKNRFDKEYLGSSDNDSLGKCSTPYKIDKYYYIPRNVKIIQKQTHN